MATQNQDRLRAHFSALPESSHSEGWDSLWKDASFLPWDRGYANPALIDLLANRTVPSASPDPNPTPGAPPPNTLSTGYRSLAPPIAPDGKRRKVLIPGCGKGYDIILFAAWGYDAYGLEISEHAVEAARSYVDGVKGKKGDKKEIEGPLEAEYRFAEESHDKGYGVMKVLQGDFFEDSWLGDVEGWKDGEGFDVIYDNTFLCALPLSLRPKWAARIVSLLRHSQANDQPSDHSLDGVLICLEFPTHKPASSGGPPWSLPPTVHAELLKQPGKEISYDDQDVVKKTDRPETDDALVRVAHYTPRRTHTVGVVKGVVRDCVSMWRHKSEVSDRERWH
ncbi:S-adenosyl-L-methionine-dependent methyltransferase [Pyrenochaeta sp. MPI-SDFR-AT-0127]|nr:S-adenosyl-L-methionine-dependent methyltransferase [Pyrenochaeta sp. MPI-SDFR-AT-0127]